MLGANVDEPGRRCLIATGVFPGPGLTVRRAEATVLHTYRGAAEWPGRPAQRLRVLERADPLNLIQVMLAKGTSFAAFPETVPP